MNRLRIQERRRWNARELGRDVHHRVARDVREGNPCYEVRWVLPTINDAEARRRHQKMLAKARARSVLQHDFPKLAVAAGEAPTIKDNPPLIHHPRERGVEDLLTRARTAFAGHRASMQEDRRVLIASAPFAARRC